MPEANVANTVTILGKTSTVRAATHWKTIAINDPANSAALKINSLFVTNNSPAYHVDIDMRLGRLTPQVPGALNRDSIYTRLLNILTLPIGATVVVISRDNPIWLQPGDFLQIVASRNYWVDVVCSYEFVSDQMINPVQTLTPPSQVLHMSAAQMYDTKGVQLAWTPPFDDGGAPITNYVVQARALYTVTPPLIESGPYEAWTGWISLHKPVNDKPSLKINTTFLSALEANNFSLVALALDTALGWQFRVAAVNPAGVGLFSEPSQTVPMSATIKIGEIRPMVTALPNRVDLDWDTQDQPEIVKPANVSMRLIGHRIRWSSDNGMTWLPSPEGQLLASPIKKAIVTNLQNSVFYTFAVQPICIKDEGTQYEQELIGPWGPPTRNVMPPGDGEETELTALFVQWV